MLIIYRLARYLNWYLYSPFLGLSRRQHKTRIFNVGNRRRLAQINEEAPTEHDARFFDPNNAEYTATREHLAMDTLEELLHWLMEENGSVGILGTVFLSLADC